MALNHSTEHIYQQIMGTVMTEMRAKVLNAGGNEELLNEIRMMWERHLNFIVHNPDHVQLNQPQHNSNDSSNSDMDSSEHVQEGVAYAEESLVQDSHSDQQSQQASYSEEEEDDDEEARNLYDRQQQRMEDEQMKEEEVVLDEESVMSDEETRQEAPQTKDKMFGYYEEVKHTGDR